MVSAWASQNRLLLGQIKTDEKSNEITAIPQLLDMIDINSCIVTIDAMGCQKNIAEKIISNKGDYILNLKGNQNALWADVDLFFKDAVETNFKDIEYDFFSSQEKGHGRIEIRNVYGVSDIDWLFGKEKWKSIKSIVLVESTREIKGKRTFERRYYISSLKSSAKEFSSNIRKHWGIENSLHWCLDVGFREDRSVSRNATSGENMTILRRMAFNLLKKDKTAKRSIENKRLKAALDEKYLENILGLQ